MPRNRDLVIFVLTDDCLRMYAHGVIIFRFKKRSCADQVQGVVTTIPAVLTHPRPAVLIPFTSVCYKKWAFTFVNYKLVKKSIISGLGQAIKVDFSGKSSDQGSFLAGIKRSRPKIGPIKF